MPAFEAARFYRIFNQFSKMNNTNLNIHFIAIGGSLMHSLAIALKHAGYNISGSDDQIYDPSKSNLIKHGILSANEGWNTGRIHDGLDAVILGMHARKDNSELQKALKLGLKIYSAPEYIYDQSQDKQRIVIGGSHGKSTITAIIMHVLKYFGREFDFALGAQVEGFENMVKITDAPIIIIEGDEYLSSPLDDTPKFLNYKHHIGLISGISWDHINVFPSEEEYVKQFELFADSTPKGGTLVYCEEDPMASVIGLKDRPDVHLFDYKTHPFVIEDGITYLLDGEERIPIKLFGRHNLQNISGAMKVLYRLNISKGDIYLAIQSFKGTSKRLELINSSASASFFVDYAHSPSKVLASTLAMKEQYPDRELVACLELHTFSSLSRDFLPNYKDGLRYANYPVVYFNPKTIEHKRLAPLTEDDIKKSFGSPNIRVFTSSSNLKSWLLNQDWNHKNLMFMSSGTFGDLNIGELANELLNES